MRIDIIVVARILDVLYNEGRLRKTHLQMASRLNYPAFLRYLGWLEEKRLVRIVHDKGVDYVELTREGRESYERVVTWLKDYLGKL
ncbi:MAG: winged helix-turn-helix domain-containing protein [Infirmifilum sp.]